MDALEFFEVGEGWKLRETFIRQRTPLGPKSLGHFPWFRYVGPGEDMMLMNKVVACGDFVPIIPPPFSTLIPFTIMSQHRSLKTSGSVGSKRSVLKRGERIKLMKSRGQWTEGRLPTNLPKTKSE